MSYNYSPLSSDLDCIRLLRLMPDGDEDAPIRCQLFNYSLHESARRTHLYEAVSYVWGDSNRVLPISIATNRFNVTENLYAALLRLRNHSFERILWVDAICINQEDDKEKEHQILFMPKIYGQADRVIVWLGEATNNSDNAIEAIRKAGRDDYSRNDLLNQQPILQLLERPWFQRIWVLQEVAAARRIQILCGSMEVDGLVFCLGLEALTNFHGLQSHARGLLHPVTYLIKEAVFRPQHISSRPGRVSLDICSLGELLDIYHTYKATKHHDKVYALLGMASDSLSTAGLSPNYEVPWKEVLQRLVKFLLGKYVSVDTWNHRDMAVINSKGRILGQVASVKINEDDRGSETFILKYSVEGLRHNGRYNWTVPASAKSVQEGDLVCLLRGASKPTVIRTYRDHFAVIMIAATPPGVARIETESMVEFPHDFLLIWNWETSQEKLQDGKQWQTVEEMIGREHSEGVLEDSLSRATRLWNVALILQDLEMYRETRVRLREAIEGYEKALGKEDLHLLTVMERLAKVYQRTGQLEKAEELISQVIQTKKRMLGEEHLDTLSSMESLSIVYKIQGRSMEVEKLEMMKHLIGLKGVQITENLVVQIANSFDEDVMKLLLRRKGEEIQITKEVVEAAARNRKSGEKVMRLLLEQKGEEIHITAGAEVEIAVQFGEPMMAPLLRQKGEKVRITEKNIVDIAESCDEHTMALLLQPKGQESGITEEAFEAAARNEKSGEDMMRLLLERKGGKIRITEGVIQAALGNWESGEKVMRVLLEQEDKEMAAARNGLSGGSLMMLQQIERERTSD